MKSVGLAKEQIRAAPPQELRCVTLTLYFATVRRQPLTAQTLTQAR